MTELEIKELLKTAADPHFIATAVKANELLMRLNAVVTDLHHSKDDLELEEDIAFDKMYDELKALGKTEQYIKNKRNISSLYIELRNQKRLLADVRAVRKRLDKHCELLSQQEKYKPRGYERVL